MKHMTEIPPAAYAHTTRTHTGSNSYGQFWFGGNSFPGFFFKKSGAGGCRRSTQMTPGGTRVTNGPVDIWNKYTPGAGVGATSVATRRAKQIKATVCGAEQKCGRFYNQLTMNQLRVSPYTNHRNNWYS
jgi:hypothetical protein